jgi:RNA polymerase sigma-70 factor (ECF subfamily)
VARQRFREDEEPSDEFLLDRAQSGDRESFGLFYRRHRDRVASFFHKQTFCPATTADLTAETFARALKGLGRFNSARGTGIAWLFCVANNVSREWLRKGVSNRRTADRLALVRGPLAGEEFARIGELSEVAAMRSALSEGLSMLTPALRDAVLMRVVSDLPYAEVAARLGCSPGAARVRVNRALAQLSSRVSGA